MTTANLSVGINTQSAKDSLKELKAYMASTVSQLAVQVDPKSIDRQTAAYFKSRKFKLAIDTVSIRHTAVELQSELERVMSQAFRGGTPKAGVREIRWNHQNFSSSIAAAFKVNFDRRDRTLQWDQAGFKLSLGSAIDQAFSVPQSVKFSVSTGSALAEIESLSKLPVHLKATVDSTQARTVITALSALPVHLLATVDTTAARTELDSLGKSLTIQAKVVPTVVPGAPAAAATLTPAPAPAKPATGALATPDKQAVVLDQLAKTAASLNHVTKRLKESDLEGDDEPSARRAMRSSSFTNKKTGERLGVSERIANSKVDETLKSIQDNLAEGIKEKEAKLRNKTEVKSAKSNPSGLDLMGQASIRLDPRVKANLSKVNKDQSDLEAERRRKELDQDKAWGALKVQAEKENSKKVNAVYDTLARERLLKINAATDANNRAQKKATTEADRQQSKAATNALANLRKREDDLKSFRDSQAKAAKKRDLTTDNQANKDVSFEKPEAKNELQRTENQLARVLKAQALVEKGKEALARKSYGNKAVDAIPNAAALTARVKALKDESELQAAEEREQKRKATAAPKEAATKEMREVQNLVGATKSSYQGLLNEQGKALAAYREVAKQFGKEKADAFFNNTWLSENKKNLNEFQIKSKSVRDSEKREAESIQNLIRTTKAKNSDEYTAKGQALLAYQAVKARFNGDTAKADAIFNNDWLRQNLDNLEKFRVKAKAGVDDIARTTREAMQELYARSQWRAKGEIDSDGFAKYTGRGVQVAGAVSLVKKQNGDKGGLANVKSFLKNDALFEEATQINDGVKSLAAYETQVTRVTNAKSLLSGGTQTLNRSMNDFHSGIRGITGSMNMLWLTWGSTIPIAAGAAIGASLRSVLMVGKDLEYQLTFVKALSNGVGVEMQDFGNTVRGTMSTPTEAAQGLRALAQNGLDAKEALTALPDILRLATAGEMSLTDAALGATGVMAAFNMTVFDLGRIGDVFALAAASSNTSVSSMVEAMRQASTVSDSYKVSLEETAASLATMAKRNIEGSAAGTAFRNMMTELATPTKKAKEAMGQLGLELYDGNNQLKSYTTVMTELKTATIGLNEKGRLNFLSQLFDERGAKAANAILSDFGLFNKLLIESKSSADGFAKSINDALGETTTGKLKSLMSEFEMTTGTVFLQVKDGINNLVDALRVFAASDDFQKWLKSTSEAVIGFSKYLLDNAAAVGYLGAGWLAARASLVLVVPAVDALALAMVGLSIKSASALAAMTGGLSLVAMLAAQYFILRKGTDEASSAQEAYTNRLTLLDAASANGLKVLKERNAELAIQIGLLKDGVSVEEAKRKSQRQVAMEQVLLDKGTSSSTISRLQAEIQAEDKLKDDKFSGRKLTRDYNPETKGELQRKLAEAQADLAKVNSREANLNEAYAQSKVGDESKASFDVLRGVAEYNKRVKDLRESTKLVFETIGEDARKNLSTPELKAMLDQYNATLNRGTSDFNVRDPSADRSATSAAAKAAAARRQLQLANLNSDESSFQGQAKNLDAQYKASMAILKAREQAKLMTVDEYEVRADQLALSHLKSREALARDEARTLEAKLAGSPDLQETDKIRATSRAEAAREELRRVEIEAGEIIEKAKAKSDGALRALTESGADARVEAVMRDIKAMQEIGQRAGSFKPGMFFGAGQAATANLFPQEFASSLSTAGLSEESRAVVRAQNEQAARERFEAKQQRKLKAEPLKGKGAVNAALEESMKAYDEAQPGIVEYTVALEQANRQMDEIRAKKGAMSARLLENVGQAEALGLLTEIGTLDKAAEGVQVRINSAKAEVGALTAMRDIGAEQRSQKAQEVYETQRSPEYAFDAFFTAYREEAFNTGKVVTNAMNQSFSSMEEGLLRFVTTGKGGFKSLVTSMLADAARMMANQAIRQLLSMGLNALSGSIGGMMAGPMASFSATNTGGAIAGGVGAVPYADGGIMTGQGNFPLQKFARGGIARTPMASLFGEGRLPEAYVPLPDGRTIPVTVSSDGSSSGGGGNTYVTNNISIASDGGSAVSSDASGTKAAALSKMVEQAVVSVITREQRAGGILAR